MAAIPDRVRSLLVDAGLALTDEDGVTVAHPAEGSLRILPARREGPERRPFEVHPVAESPAPWWVVGTLADALRRDRGVLFVPTGRNGADVADRIADVLATPTGVSEADEDGARTFYESPDRIHLDGGGLALSESRRPAFTWREELPEEPPTVDGRPRTGADRKRLVLEDRDRTVAVLDGVDALGCPRPAPEAFPYSYRREDGVFAVRARDGRLVGTFAGVRAMREAGFAPVPAPVIPEFEFPAPPGFEWAVLDPEDRLRDSTGQRRIDR